MSLRTTGRFRSSAGSFNMIPIIDIVFLLIIFFLVVCQFIEAENFPVAVPDGCEFAQSDAEPGVKVTTVTVMKTNSSPRESCRKASCGLRTATGKEKVAFAVGSEKISTSGYANIVEKLAQLIDVRLKDLPPDRRVVTLRIDKDVCFADAQYALAGIAASSATDFQLATLKDKRADSE